MILNVCVGEEDAARRGALLTFVASVLLTAALWWYLLGVVK